MKGVVQARRYIGDLVRVLLGKEGQVTFKAIWFRVPGCFNLAKASSLDSGVLVFVDKVRGTIKELRLTAMDRKGEMLRWN